MSFSNAAKAVWAIVARCIGANNVPKSLSQCWLWWNIANNKNPFLTAILKAKYYPYDSWNAPNRGSRLSTKASQQSTSGYTHDSSLSVDRCVSYEFDGDARHRQGFYPDSAAVWA